MRTAMAAGMSLEGSIEPLLKGGLVGDGNGDWDLDTVQVMWPPYNTSSSPASSLKSQPPPGRRWPV